MSTFLLLAQAAPAAPTEETSELLKRVLEAVTGGHWKPAAALLVILLVQIVKLQGSKLFPVLAKGWAAFVTAIVLAVALGCANVVATGGSITLPLIIDGLQIGFLAAGGWSGFKVLWEAKKGTPAPGVPELKPTLDKLTDKDPPGAA